jgi:uncharacterized integral membrane protein (TIGR00698 family)
MLFALLLGMAFSFLADDRRSAHGIGFASRGLLRVGVALLGFRISWAQLTALGWEPLAMVIAVVGLTIVASIILARTMGFNPLFGFLSGGATAICGASAALALAAALPAHTKKEQATLFTVIGVSLFSTLAMITYPLIASAAGLSDRAAGVFIGATIHDVAQVVGAGYAISTETGDTATVVKLLRVAMLLPVILIAGQITRAEAASGAVRPPLLPWFVVAFASLVVINSVAQVPAWITGSAGELSRWCLIAAIAAIGMKTRLGEIVKLGVRPIALMLLETVLLATLVLGALKAGLV